MHKETFPEFRKRYLKVVDRIGSLVFSQSEKCNACKEQDYRACVKECVELSTTLKQIAAVSKEFPWLRKRGAYNLLTMVKSFVQCRAWGVEDFDLEVKAPPVTSLSPQDKKAIANLFKLFATVCKTCSLKPGVSCLDCPETKHIELELDTRNGREVFNYLLMLQAEYKRDTEPAVEREVRFFYERFYLPPGKGNTPSPKDLWAFYGAVRLNSAS